MGNWGYGYNPHTPHISGFKIVFVTGTGPLWSLSWKKTTVISVFLVDLILWVTRSYYKKYREICFMIFFWILNFRTSEFLMLWSDGRMFNLCFWYSFWHSCHQFFAIAPAQLPLPRICVFGAKLGFFSYDFHKMFKDFHKMFIRFR